MTENKELTGKVALSNSTSLYFMNPTPKNPNTNPTPHPPVTGSSRGIGAAIALKLASHGASIALNYISTTSGTAADTLASQIRNHDVRVITIQADVSSEPDVAALFEVVKREFGRIDIVVSNAGIEHFGPLGEVHGEEIDRILAVNVKGQYFVAQEAFRHVEEFGRVMLTSSISAVKVREH